MNSKTEAASAAKPAIIDLLFILNPRSAKTIRSASLNANALRKSNSDSCTLQPEFFARSRRGLRLHWRTARGGYIFCKMPNRHASRRRPRLQVTTLPERRRNPCVEHRGAWHAEAEGRALQGMMAKERRCFRRGFSCAGSQIGLTPVRESFASLNDLHRPICDARNRAAQRNGIRDPSQHLFLSAQKLKAPASA